MNVEELAICRRFYKATIAALTIDSSKTFRSQWAKQREESAVFAEFRAARKEMSDLIHPEPSDPRWGR